MDLARTKLSAVQAQTYSSEGALSSLEEALNDRDKQVQPLTTSQFVFDEFFFLPKLITLDKIQPFSRKF